MSQMVQFWKLAVLLLPALASCEAFSPPTSSLAPILEAPKISLNGNHDGYTHYFVQYRSDGSDASKWCETKNFTRYCYIASLAPLLTNGETKPEERTPIPYGEGKFVIDVEFASSYELTCFVVYRDEENRTLPLSSKPHAYHGWYGKMPFDCGSYTREINDKDNSFEVGEFDEETFASLYVAIIFSSPYFGWGMSVWRVGEFA